MWLPVPARQSIGSSVEKQNFEGATSANAISGIQQGHGWCAANGLLFGMEGVYINYIYIIIILGFMFCMRSGLR